MKSRFLGVYLLQALYCLPYSLGGSFLLLFYLKLGFTASQIVSYYLVHYSTILLALLLLRNQEAFNLIRMSFMLCTAGFLAAAGLGSTFGFYLIAVLLGLTSALFWVPYNILYFSHVRGDSRALLSGFSFLILPLLNTVMPIMTGVLIDQRGFRFACVVSALVSLASLAYAHVIREPRRMDLDCRRTLEGTRVVRTLVYVEGFWQGIAWTCIPLVTLSFIETGIAYGTFLSYLGLTGAFAVLLLCRISDRLRNRAVFITPFITLAALSTIAAYTARTLGLWTLVNGLISFFIAMTSPFTLSVVLDKVGDVRDGMVARELFLNIGRASGVLVIILGLWLTGDLRTPLVVAGLVLMLYPLILLNKKLYPSRLSLRSIMSGEAYEFRET